MTHTDPGMSVAPIPPLGFWTTLWLLLRTARKRAAGRHDHQMKLLRWSTGGKGLSFSANPLGLIVGIVISLIINSLAAWLVIGVVRTGASIEAQKAGRLVVDERFITRVDDVLQYLGDNQARLKYYYDYESNEIAHEYGGRKEEIADRLRQEIEAHGTRNLVNVSGLAGLAYGGRFAALLGSLALLWWFAMLVCQGEGVELDTQRRRRPMWEWLFSHPVSPGPVFLAEMLSPIITNPLYCTAPVFAGILYGVVYGLRLGIVAGFVIGIPVTIAAACLGKALEIAIVLRFSPRSRGAMLGLMGWFGYSSQMLFFLAAPSVKDVVPKLAGPLTPLTLIPWPWLGLFLGQQPGGAFSFAFGLIATWVVVASIVAGSVALRDLGCPAGTRPRRRPDRAARSGEAGPVRQGSAVPQRAAVVPARPQRHRAGRAPAADHGSLPAVQSPLPACPGPGCLELHLRRRRPLRDLFPDRARSTIPCVRGDRAVARPDLAARARRSAQGQGAALDPDRHGHRRPGPVLRRLPLP
jgi:hypothetical protein